MFGKPLIGSCLFVLGLTLAAVPAQAAPITIAGVTYDSVNFADTLVSSSGTFTTAGGALASVVTDVSVDTYAFSLETGSYLQLSFTNNTPINGIGNDLVLFEIGTPDNFGLSLTVGGPIVSLASVSSGFSQSGGFGINVASIDLALLGVALLLAGA